MANPGTRRQRAAARWRAATLAAATAAGHLVRAAPALLGLLLVSAGAWMAWHPAGPLTAGVILLADVVASRIRPKGGPR
jgi:ABC-type protease/lipase transport system fused ATPase/permease subunit